MSDYSYYVREVARDRNLSMKEKGLLLTLLYMNPEDSPTAKRISTDYLSDGQNTIASALRNLESKGLIRRRRVLEGAKIKGMKVTIQDRRVRHGD